MITKARIVQALKDHIEELGAIDESKLTPEDLERMADNLDKNAIIIQARGIINCINRAIERVEKE